MLKPRLSLTAALLAALPLLTAPGSAAANDADADAAKVELHGEAWPDGHFDPPAELTEAEAAEELEEARVIAEQQRIEQEAALENPIELDIEMILLIDSSISVDDTEYALQRSGYVEAFRDPEIHALIESRNGIYVDAYDFSSTSQWRRLGNAFLYTAQDCLDFADTLAVPPRKFANNTIIGKAIGNAGYVLRKNTFDGRAILSRRQVIDISGDGICEAFLHYQAQADEDGVQPRASDPIYGDSWSSAYASLPYTCVVNAISIGDTDNLAGWYAQTIPHGAGSFAMHADSFESFGDAIKVKILREITALSDSFD